MMPIGVQTPSSASNPTRADRLRKPLESPYLSSPLTLSFSTADLSNKNNNSSIAPSSSSSSSSHGRRHGDNDDGVSLSDRHLREIQTVFQIFDPTLSGYIDVPTFEVMVRSLGFRMTRVEIAGMVEMLWEERQQQQQQQQGQHAAEADASERRQINLSTAIQILSKRGYANRSEEDEMQMYFRIFDGGNKGYIDLKDLKRVQKEVKEAEKEMDVNGSGMDVGAVGDATLEAMIEQFDHDRDGVIDYEEFKNVLEPVLLSSSDSL